MHTRILWQMPPPPVYTRNEMSGQIVAGNQRGLERQASHTRKSRAAGEGILANTTPPREGAAVGAATAWGHHPKDHAPMQWRWRAAQPGWMSQRTLCEGSSRSSSRASRSLSPRRGRTPRRWRYATRPSGTCPAQRQQSLAPPPWCLCSPLTLLVARPTAPKNAVKVGGEMALLPPLGRYTVGCQWPGSLGAAGLAASCIFEAILTPTAS